MSMDEAKETRVVRILAVDDEEFIVRLYKEALSTDENIPACRGPFRYEVTTARDGSEAMEAAEDAARTNRPYALTFLDMRLGPGPQGDAVAHRLRELDPNVSIVIVTGHSEVTPESLSLKIPPYDKLLYLQKPFHIEEIRQFATALGAKWYAEKALGDIQAGLESRVEERTAELANQVSISQAQEQELRTQERFLQSVFDAIQDGISVLDPNLRILRANAAMQERFGSEGDITGRQCHDIYRQDPSMCRDCPSRKALDTGVRCTMVTSMRVPGAGERWYELSSFPMADEAGGKAGVVEVARDITERIESEKQLRLKEALLDAASEAILLLDLKRAAILDVNHGVGTITGFTREELLGKRLSDLSSGEAPFSQTEADLILKRVKAGEDLLVEWQARHKDGHPFWVEISLKRVSFDGGDRILACARDITGRKKAEEELVQIREALDDSSDAVVVVDREGVATYINVAFGTTFGFTRDQEEAISLGSLFADDAAGKEIVDSVLGGAGWEGEAEMVSKEGRRFPASVRATPVMDDSFEVIAALFILDDITERRQLEAQLVQSQNLKSIGQLAAGIAHEMNTPLQYVGDNIRFLRDSFDDLLGAVHKLAEAVSAAQDNEPGSPLAQRILEILEEADLDYLSEEVPLAIEQSLEGTGRVTHIVRAMRQFTHPGTKNKQLVNLNQALDSTITVARNEWRYVADLETDFAEGLPGVPCMPGEFNQVILNLIVNASHAIADVVGDGSEQKGKITVSTAQVGGFAEIRISDTGTGIPEDVQAHVFDPFFTTKEVGKGTGQGLAISRSVIVDKHGGTLDFETAPGEGTTFVIRLPLSVDEDNLEDATGESAS